MALGEADQAGEQSRGVLGMGTTTTQLQPSVATRECRPSVAGAFDFRQEAKTSEFL